MIIFSLWTRIAIVQQSSFLFEAATSKTLTGASLVFFGVCFVEHNQANFLLPLLSHTNLLSKFVVDKKKVTKSVWRNWWFWRNLRKWENSMKNGEKIVSFYVLLSFLKRRMMKVNSSFFQIYFSYLVNKHIKRFLFVLHWFNQEQRTL